MTWRRALLLIAIGGAGAVLAAPAPHAATVYRWVDANGTVHFGDSPPAQGSGVQQQSMPNAPPAAPPAAAAPGPPAAEAPAAPKQPLHGPASVVLEHSETVAVGPSTQAIRGKVRNKGGAPADRVVVDVVVTEPVQGAECLRDVIDVEPATLAPGAEGTFDAEFENPCFFGPTDAALTAEWR